MKLTTAIPIILSVTAITLTSGCIQQSIPVVVNINPGEPAVVNVKPGTATTINIVPAPTPVPTIQKTQKMPDFKVTLWSAVQQPCSYSGFLGSCTPEKYIMPNNEVVKYISLYLDINKRGALEWRTSNIIGLGDGIFTNNYITDNELYNNPPNGDYWVNPDWYLTHDFRGDCEDSAFAVASILEAKGYKTKIVGGYLTYDNKRTRDWIVEYKINSGYYRYFGGAFNVGFISRDGFEQYKGASNVDFEPVLMFDKNSYYGDYNANW